MGIYENIYADDIAKLKAKVRKLEKERDKYKNMLKFLMITKANDKVKMGCIVRALKK